jgi:hypothetical protein
VVHRQPPGAQTDAATLPSDPVFYEYRPWLFNDFVRRLSTYTPSRWCGVGLPHPLSPLHAARFGWIAVERHALTTDSVDDDSTSTSVAASAPVSVEEREARRAFSRGLNASLPAAASMLSVMMRWQSPLLLGRHLCFLCSVCCFDVLFGGSSCAAAPVERASTLLCCPFPLDADLAIGESLACSTVL